MNSAPTTIAIEDSDRRAVQGTVAPMVRRGLSVNGVDLAEGQRWFCRYGRIGGYIVEIVCIRFPPVPSACVPIIGGYIKTCHKLVEMELDDFVHLANARLDRQEEAR